MDPSVAAVEGQTPDGSNRTNGSPAYASADRTASTVAPGRVRAVTVARMPRGIGARIGVMDRLDAPVARLISGTCWCVPTRYGSREPMTSLAIRWASTPRPAPDVPDAATTTTSAGSANPAAISGASARIVATA